MTSFVKISEFKNGEEKKRNPRKEKERNAISGNEEESTYVNFPHWFWWRVTWDSESGRKEDKPFTVKNGEEKKRNPRKEIERKAISGNEEERTYVNFPH